VPNLAVGVLTTASTLLSLGLAALGWGELSSFLAHPARAGACLVIVLATIAMFFTDVNLSGFRRADSQYRWLLVPMFVVFLAILIVPTYTDRREIWTLDGDAVRYLGLAMLAIGLVFRVGPMFALGRRFTWPLASQDEDHRLLTTGFYRYIRHPSYLGGLVAMFGWALVFRSAIGLILNALLVPVFIGFIPKEEALLKKEFGVAYDVYQQRTWRMVPFVY
jgi:protein-S-isoprenylcysteine O-methyltransferase Ste14